MYIASAARVEVTLAGPRVDLAVKVADFDVSSTRFPVFQHPAGPQMLKEHLFTVTLPHIGALRLFCCLQVLRWTVVLSGQVWSNTELASRKTTEQHLCG